MQYDWLQLLDHENTQCNTSTQLHANNLCTSLTAWGRGQGQGTTCGQGSGRGQGTTRRMGWQQRAKSKWDIKMCKISDTNFEEPEEFQPLRDPGEPSSYCETRTHYIGHILSFHRWWWSPWAFDNSYNQYAAPKRERTQTTYKQFKRHPLTAEEVMRFLGCLLLLSINSVRNYRQAWNSNSILHLVQLSQLLARECFEHIASLLHLVTPSEEAQLSQHRLKKILPFHQHAKQRCLEL